MKRIGNAVSGTAPIVVLVIPLTLILVCATVAFAQSADDQYGSPVDPVRPAVAAIGVLPDTGGPLSLLIIGGLLVFAGAVLAVRSRISSGRR